MEYIIFIILVCALCYKCEETSDNYETRKTTVNFMIDELKRQVDMDNSFNYRVLRPPNIESEYDFIIIGSGSAGSVIANRLSEVEKWKILLLEVGREATGFSDIPQLAPALQFTDLNWGYLMEKQEGVALGLVDQRMAWPRGRALGGSSVINYMLNVRGNREDYNRWERMGNPGWSYRDVFQYFVKSEDASIAVNDTGYHAKGGYLSVQDVPYRTESAHAWVRACQEAGYKYVDYNGRQQLGVSYVQGTINNGRRCSVEKAFLRTAKDRPNLTILTEAWVTKILIDDENKQAYGVQYVKNGQYYTVRAKNEVILSAGTFNSPQLLMLSGIGPKKHLEELGIQVLQDLPVGQKMYDHLTFLGLIFTVNDSITTKTEDIFSINSFLQWKTLGEGPHTGLGGVEAFTYIKTENNTQRKSPDVELIFVGLSLGVDAGALIRKTFRITDYHFKQYWGPLIGRPAFQVLPMLLFPKSFGHLKLSTKNPFDSPKLYGNFFTDSGGKDMETFVASIREIQRIVKNSHYLKRYNASSVSWPIPGCEKEIWDSDSYWKCGLRHLSQTLHHQVTTCKMGPKEDPEAVVDHTLKVHGVKRLRVIDSSIFPTPIAAHTNTPTIMVGEKASDMIKQEWKVKPTSKTKIYVPDDPE